MMTAGHHHHHHDHGAIGSLSGKHASRLAWALALTLAYLLAELVGAYITGSLALLADAAHMLTDAGGLALALFAIWFARRPPDTRRSFGYLRAEILAALANAVVLLLLTIYIFYEAYHRFLSPPEILSGPMLAVAVLGLVVNLISMRLLAEGASESLNVKGAYFEVLSDALGSLGVIIAALVIMFTGWRLADPIVGVGIGLFIIPRTWRLMMQAVHILLEGTPHEIDVGQIEADLRAIPGVTAIHDTHVWTITSGLHSMTCHLVVEDMTQARRILQAATQILSEKHDLNHTTVQIEDKELRRAEKHVGI